MHFSNLKVMDMTAFTLCMENNLPIIVFDMNKPGNLKRVVTGDQVGTLVYGLNAYFYFKFRPSLYL